MIEAQERHEKSPKKNDIYSCQMRLLGGDSLYKYVYRKTGTYRIEIFKDSRQNFKSLCEAYEATLDLVEYYLCYLLRI